jgi:hypothetical protein
MFATVAEATMILKGATFVLPAETIPIKMSAQNLT